MIRVLLWKEYREHRAVWLSLALAGSAGLYTLSVLMAPGGLLNTLAANESLRTVAVLFAWTYGLVCGSMLLANEVENGTLTFLDLMPARRGEIWLVKCLFGLLLFALQLVVLAAFVLGLGIAETPRQLVWTLLSMVGSGLLALSWGMLFSARGEYVLNVIGLAIVGQILGLAAASLLFVVLATAQQVLWGSASEIAGVVIICLAVLALLIAPLYGSARIFTHVDRLRRNRSARSAKAREVLPFGTSWVRLLWLSYAQMRRMLLGLTILALVLGFALPMLGPVGWPMLTLLIGILCGVTVWSDEQFAASFRFLGDQRFPLGRVWTIKLGTRFALASFAAFVLLSPSLVMAVSHRIAEKFPNERIPFWSDLLHCDLIGPIVPPGTHLTLWLLYGFTTGQLCGLLFRKSLVAGVVSLGTATMLVCLWIPSLLGIGLHFWQIIGVPLALLVASRLLVSAWAADRLVARATFLRLGSSLAVAGLWTIGGIYYRIAEIPDVPEPFDVQAFTAEIPSLDKERNEAGMKIRNAWNHVEKLTAKLYVVDSGKPLFDDMLVDGDKKNTFVRQIGTAFNRGWPDHFSEVGDWLNVQFRENAKEDWYSELKAAARLPLGAVEDTKLLTFDTRLRDWNSLHALNEILAARSLQRQTAGDARAFVDNVRISLALSRNFRNHTPQVLAQIGLDAECGVLRCALDRWLEKLPNDSQVLEQLRDVLLEHESQRPDEGECVKAGYLIAQNSLESEPSKLIDIELNVGVQPRRERKELREAEIETAALFWRVPWERERHERILRSSFQNDPQQHRRIVAWGGKALETLTLMWHRQEPSRGKQSLVELHDSLRKVRTLLSQVKNRGKLPARLDHLPAIPNDP